MDGGQAWAEVGHEEGVVETDDGDVIRDRQSHGGDRSNCAERLQVRSGDDCCNSAFDQAGRMGCRGLVCVEGFLDDGGVVTDQLAP